jgi:hypothetical protein
VELSAASEQPAIQGSGADPAAPQVFFSGARVEGTGRITDLSLTGLRIAGATTVPKVDSELLLVVVSGDAAGVDAQIVVTRTLADGFAARFKVVDPRLQAAVAAWQGAASQ